MNRGNIVNLEDIDDVGVIGVDTPAKQEKQVIQEEKPKLIRGAVKENVVVDDEDGFTDLSQLKNLKILTEEANDTDEDDTVIENLDDAISRQIAVMTSMKESFEELREEQDRIDGIQVIGDDDEEEEIDADKYWSNLLHLTRKKFNLLASERESFKKTNKVKAYLAYKGYEFDLMNDAIEIVKSEDWLQFILKIQQFGKLFEKNKRS